MTWVSSEEIALAAEDLLAGARDRGTRDWLRALSAEERGAVLAAAVALRRRRDMDRRALWRLIEDARQRVRDERSRRDDALAAARECWEAMLASAHAADAADAREREERRRRRRRRRRARAVATLAARASYLAGFRVPSGSEIVRGILEDDLLQAVLNALLAASGSRWRVGFGDAGPYLAPPLPRRDVTGAPTLQP